MKFFRPALRFLLLGGFLFGASRLLGWASGLPGSPEKLGKLGKPEIVLDAARLSTLRANAEYQLGHDPDAREWHLIMREAADEEMLVHEAIRRAWHRGDLIVRRRLLQNMHFVARAGVAQPTNETAELEAAYALGMHQHDPVVRQRLVQMMRQALQIETGLREPTQQQLAAYARAHASEMAVPSRLSFSHIFQSGAQAKTRLDQLAKQNPSPATATALSAPFFLGTERGPANETQIAADFGVAFAAQVMQLTPGRWSAPIASAYGMHLVWVKQRLPGGPPTNAYLLEHAGRALSAVAENEALVAGLQRLRSQYRFRIATGDVL